MLSKCANPRVTFDDLVLNLGNGAIKGSDVVVIASEFVINSAHRYAARLATGHDLDNIREAKWRR